MSELYRKISSNPFTISLDSIPVLDYAGFFDQTVLMMKDEAEHCAALYAVEMSGAPRLFCCLANDNDHCFRLYSTELPRKEARFPRFQRKFLSFMCLSVKFMRITVLFLKDIPG